MTTQTRSPLTKERVLHAAVDLADRDGIDALSMRRLAQALGVEAMSLYNHVRSKDDILDGVVDVIVGQIEITPTSGADWRTAMRQQAIGARKVLLRHRWAPRVIESRRTMSPAMLRYMDSVVGILLDGGFSLDLTHHALHVLGSRVLGFTQDLFEDTSQLDTTPEMAAIMAREMANQFPHLTALAGAVSHEGGLGACDDDVEFEFGLDLILDGLAHLYNPRTRRRRQPLDPPAHGMSPQVTRAIDELRAAAARDQTLVRQLRATFVDLFDAVLAAQNNHTRPPG